MNQKNENSKLWQQIMKDMSCQGGVGEYGFDTFLSALSLKQDTGKELIIECAESGTIDWIEINYADSIKASATRVLNEVRNIRIVAAGTEDLEVAPAEEPVNTPAVTTRKKASRKSKPRKVQINTGLNSDFNLASFSVGDHNHIAWHAAVQTVTKTGIVPNPIYIHGSNGMGKTHLMQAIGNAIVENGDDTQVLYITSEEFTNSYIEAITNNSESLTSFRRRYRMADVLLIDDVQFLAQKGKTQEEFFHTFNALISAGKQIIMTSDCPVSRLTNMDERLTARFEQGLVVQMHAPEYEARLAILRNKRDRWNSEYISDEILEYLAKNITKSVRRLEGALIRLNTIVSLSRRTPAVSELRHLLSDYLREDRAGKVCISDIQRVVADEFAVKVEDINGRRRTADVIPARQLAMYLARTRTEMTLSEIGAAFGGRDHGTVLYATNTIKKRLKTDDELRERVNKLTAAF